MWINCRLFDMDRDWFVATRQIPFSFQIFEMCFCLALCHWKLYTHCDYVQHQWYAYYKVPSEVHKNLEKLLLQNGNLYIERQHFYLGFRRQPEKSMSYSDFHPRILKLLRKLLLKLNCTTNHLTRTLNTLHHFNLFCIQIFI